MAATPDPGLQKWVLAVRDHLQAYEDQRRPSAGEAMLTPRMVRSVQLSNRRQIEHDLLVSMGQPITLRRRVVTALACLRQWIERVEDRILPAPH